MKRLAVYCNVFWILFALVVCFEARRLGLGTIHKPGSGLFPFGAGALMLVLAVISLAQARGASTHDRGGGAKLEEPIRWWNVVIVLAGMAAYALTLETVGFILNTFLFVGLLLKVVDPQPWKKVILGGAITALLANVLFNTIFKAQIPSGIWGF